MAHVKQKTSERRTRRMTLAFPPGFVKSLDAYSHLQEESRTTFIIKAVRMRMAGLGEIRDV